MTTEKRKVRISWLSEWQVLEHEAWFEDMARQGWHLEHMGYWFTNFIEGEPEEKKYKIEIAKKNDAIESDRIRQYQDAGWEFVTTKNHLYVFREKEVNKGKEIHTDPVAQAETMEVLKKSIWKTGIIMIIATIIFSAFFYIDIKTMSSYQLLGDGLLNSLLYIIIYLPLSIHWIGGMFQISSLIRKRRRGEVIDYQKTYKGKVNRIKLGSFLIAAVYITFFSYSFIKGTPLSEEERFPEIPSAPLPVVKLTEIEGVDADETAYHSHGIVRKRENHYRESNGLLFPRQYILQQKFIIPEDGKNEQSTSYQPSIQASKYEARTEGLAETLTEALMKEAHWPNDQGPEKVSILGLDEVWVFESDSNIEIIARRSVDVFNINYNGEQSSQVFYKWLEGQVDEHS